MTTSTPHLDPVNTTQPSDLSPGAKAGIAIGGAIGGIAIAAGALYLIHLPKPLNRVDSQVSRQLEVERGRESGAHAGKEGLSQPAYSDEVNTSNSNGWLRDPPHSIGGGGPEAVHEIG